MKQEDKELLLKDLCARLPYKIKVRIYNDSWEGCKKGEFDNTMGFHHVEAFKCDRIEIEPYLRPMSSMTEEEFVYFMSIRGMNLKSHEIQEMMSKNFSHPNSMSIVNTFGRYSHNIDWLNENMFDYRGLIEKGLALEVPEGMYGKKE